MDYRLTPKKFRERKQQFRRKPYYYYSSIGELGMFLTTWEGFKTTYQRVLDCSLYKLIEEPSSAIRVPENIMSEVTKQLNITNNNRISDYVVIDTYACMGISVFHTTIEMELELMYSKEEFWTQRDTITHLRFDMKRLNSIETFSVQFGQYLVKLRAIHFKYNDSGDENIVLVIIHDELMKHWALKYPNHQALAKYAIEAIL